MPIPNRPGFHDTREMNEFTDELTLRGKLAGIERDSGFLPTTHTEKTMALQLMDSPAEMGGEHIDPATLITFIGDHSIKEYRKRHGIPGDVRLIGEQMDERREERDATIQSIVLTWTDFYYSAAYSHGVLRRLGAEAKAADMNPQQKVPEKVVQQHLAIPYLVRFLTITDLVRNGFDPALTLDPMRTIQRRYPHPETIRHKYLTDEFDISPRLPEIDEHISRVMEAMTMQELRAALDPACSNERNRADFWGSELQGLQRFPVAREAIQFAKAEKRGMAA